MEVSRVIIGLACVFGFLCAGCGWFFVRSYTLQLLRRQKLRNHTSSHENGSALLRNGISWLYLPANVLLKLPVAQSYFERMVQYFSRKNKPTTLQALASISVAFLAVSLMVSTVFLGTIVFGMAGFVCVILAINIAIRKDEEKLRNQVRESIPEALQSMKACFYAGFSLPQILNQLSKEIDGPLARLFAQMKAMMDSGSSIEEALEFAKAQSKESELVFIAATLEIQHKTGSSIAQILDSARDSVSDELELKRTLQTQTAQAKLSAQIVTLMPFALIAVFSLISPGFLAPFFESFVGVVLLVIALVMQISGVVLVRKFLCIEEG